MRFRMILKQESSDNIMLVISTMTNNRSIVQGWFLTAHQLMSCHMANTNHIDPLDRSF